jgi:hypothetical protein
MSDTRTFGFLAIARDRPMLAIAASTGLALMLCVVGETSIASLSGHAQVRHIDVILA